MPPSFHGKRYDFPIHVPRPGTARTREPGPDGTPSIHDAFLVQDHASDTNSCEEEISPPTLTLNEGAGSAKDYQCLMAPLGCSLGSALSTKEPIYVVMKTRTILEHLWAENNPAYFGPYGLHKQMSSNQRPIYASGDAKLQTDYVLHRVK